MTAMALWFLDLLDRGRALGTIKRYAGSLARGLAGRFGQEDPATMSPSQIELLLEDVLALMPAQERIYQSARLRQLWDFASSDPRLWWPEIDLSVEGRSTPSVRTALVFGTMITQLLKHFEGRPAYQAAVLLAARGGLRLSDMEALRVGDVEVQPKGMLLIHPTLWSDLKTSSARRVLPFERFLTPEERKIWTRFLNLKRFNAASADASLLSDEREIDPQQSFDRHLFAKSLSVMGLRPHDLRHGALCNLALVLFPPNPFDPLISQMTGWNINSLETLQKLLIGNDPWRGTKALARLAGHYDPKTTFESYIHICDFALGLHVKLASPPGEPHMILRQLGLNRRSLPKKKGRVTVEILRAKVLKQLSIKDVTQAQKAPRQIIRTAASQMTLSLFLQIEKAFCAGRNVLEIANDFDLPFRVVNKLAARPRLKSLRGKRDQKRLLELCETLLRHPDARSWALHIARQSG